MPRTFNCPRCSFPAKRAYLPAGYAYTHVGGRVCLVAIPSRARPPGHVQTPVIADNKAEIIRLAVAGKGNPAIAAVIGVAPSTISRALKQWGRYQYIPHNPTP